MKENHCVTRLKLGQEALLTYNNTAFTQQIEFRAISRHDTNRTEPFHNGGELLTRGPFNGVVHTVHRNNTGAFVWLYVPVIQTNP